MAKKQFKAESKRLLDLMINSIYTHQEIFLREIISNASDAIDKLAYLALTDEKVGLSRNDFAIRLAPDTEKRVLTVSDNGIGMDKDEMEIISARSVAPAACNSSRTWKSSRIWTSSGSLASASTRRLWSRRT